MGEQVRISSLNVRGLRSPKRYRIFSWLKEQNYDICLLQETFWTKDFVSKFKRGWPGDIIHSVSDSSHSRGVCILFKKGLQYNILDVKECHEGRLLVVNIDINGHVYSIINVYSPNNLNERLQFLCELSEWIDKYALNKKNIIIGGDLNCVNERKDRKSNNVDKSTDKIREIKAKYNLLDTWREMHPDKLEYTFIHPSNSNMYSRIDFFLCSRDILLHTHCSDIRYAPAPDHKAIEIGFGIAKNKRGKGYWKMNTSILDDNEYRKSMETLIVNTFNEYDTILDKITLWEFLKVRIKHFTIEYSVSMASKKRSDVNMLEDRLKNIDLLLAKCNDTSLERERNECKNALDMIYDEKSKGYQVRSRAKWVESGEKSTRYFLGLEKIRQGNNTITMLIDQNGTIKDNDEDILAVASDYYKQLYQSVSPSDDEINDYIRSIDIENALNDDEKLLCEGKVTFAECESTVKAMKRNKSPGLDGICIEFYQVFWPLIGHFLVDVFNLSYSNGMLSPSQRSAVMTLIHKKDDRDDINNYRPISLTNVDYSILAHILANRLQKVIGKIVSEDQNAYIKIDILGII